jgi:hypothetical protein
LHCLVKKTTDLCNTFLQHLCYTFWCVFNAVCVPCTAY